MHRLVWAFVVHMYQNQVFSRLYNKFMYIHVNIIFCTLFYLFISFSLSLFLQAVIKKGK